MSIKTNASANPARMPSSSGPSTASAPDPTGSDSGSGSSGSGSSGSSLGSDSFSASSHLSFAQVLGAGVLHKLGYTDNQISSEFHVDPKAPDSASGPAGASGDQSMPSAVAPYADGTKLRATAAKFKAALASNGAKADVQAAALALFHDLLATAVALNSPLSEVKTQVSAIGTKLKSVGFSDADVQAMTRKAQSQLKQEVQASGPSGSSSSDSSSGPSGSSSSDSSSGPSGSSSSDSSSGPSGSSSSDSSSGPSGSSSSDSSSGPSGSSSSDSSSGPSGSSSGDGPSPGGN